MPYQELPGLGMRGLNTDTPPQALDHTHFSAGLNMRPFDGSLQQVYYFANELNDNLAGSTIRDVHAFAQWTSSGEQTLNVAYFYDHHDERDHFRLQIVEDITNSSNSMVTGAVASTSFQPSPRFNIDLIAFNDILVTNDGTNHPVWLYKDGDEYTASLLPGWPSGSVTSASDNDEVIVLQLGTTSGSYDTANGEPNWLTQTDINTWPNFQGTWDASTRYYYGDIVVDANIYYRLDSSSLSGMVSNTAPAEDSAWVSFMSFPRPTIGARIEVTGTQTFTSGWVGTPVSVERFVPFNNRLVALNISEEYLASESYGNTTLLWSTPITALGDLAGMEWAASSTNSAGDDILTETTGEILDAGVLGQYLMVYKSDSVYRYTDVGEPLYLVGEPLFTDDGLYSPECFADLGGGRHFVLGNYGMYIHDGGPNKQNVSRGRVQDYFYSRIVPDRRDDVFMFHHKNDKEVWLCYPFIEQYSDSVPYISGQSVVARTNANTGETKYYMAWKSSTEPSIYNDPTVSGQSVLPSSDDFSYANTGNTFQWVEIQTSGCNFALVYNYELDTWYERTLPISISSPQSNQSEFVDRDFSGFGLRGIGATELNGSLVIVGWGDQGFWNLRSERANVAIENHLLTDYGSTNTSGAGAATPGYIELHYLTFGDASKVKHLHTIYPHTTSSVKVDVDTTNNLGISGQPDFLTDDRIFDAASDDYKLDYRTHGRYYHIRLESNTDGGVIINPEVTGMGMMMKIGGQR